MKITFPHLGPVYLVLNPVLREMGLDIVIPSANDSTVLEQGKTLAPEEMCLPFKYMMGNLMEAHEKGAQRVIMPATIGPCRLGEYGELLKSVLDHNGYTFQWILLDTPKAIGARAFLQRLKDGTEEKTVSDVKALAILLKGVRLMHRLDDLEAKIKEKAGWIDSPGECVKLLRHVRKKLAGAKTLKEGFRIIEDVTGLLELLPEQPGRKPVRVLLTGEIYTLIESAANQNLEEKLMLAGCSVKRNITISWWIKRTIKDSFPEFRQKKNGYLPYHIGGFAKETIEEIIAPDHKDCDGVIKIMPTGCMPEIVAKAACGRISEEQGTKILNLIFDEMSGSAGYETRLEAFVDMLERRRKCIS